MYNNILIVKLSAIGDVIHALPVAHALKKCFPKSRITWVVERPAYDLLTNNPDIDEILIFDKPKFKSLSGMIRYAPSFIKRLREDKFDLALDLQGLFKSSMISLLSGADKRLVYENAREGSHLLSKRIIGTYSKEHVVDRYLDVVRSLGCQVDKAMFNVVITLEEKELTRRIAAQAGLNIEMPYVVLALGANWPNKIWPFEHFAELSNKLYDTNRIPVMIGGSGDKVLAEQISSMTKIPPIDLTGKTTLKQLAYVIQKAQAFIGGDTGPMHLSTAVGTPTLALMGPTDPARNGPYGKGHEILITPRDCAGCWQRSCPKKLDCLDVITPETVHNQVKILLERREV
ncbi:glycosyltransferase family 9 protein [Pelosinus propionicus]|uniref:Heptosyltransferase-1 n=1 Tax=Pelosinus propionicus DSM 13327 TaxID=1123291 RepID=A0A1I4MQX0_9FIRM|nr:glycosyltransferase family 9 protein [Pelosinus propionicus]SFM05470.1 heptosyltransferase-1 [Pelosinus propionicus DSM 13327]